MPHAIARIEKLNAGNITSSALHTTREVETPNANSEVANIRFVGEGDNRPLKEVESRELVSRRFARMQYWQ